jgi:hypothetical protein
MKWRLEFHSERARIVARYVVEAPTPIAALALGRSALHTEYPLSAARRRCSLWDQAQRIAGQDAGGWVLYRIAKDQ